LKLAIIDVREPEAFESSLEQARRQTQALLVLADPANKGTFAQVAALVATHRLPAIYVLRDFADAGGLMALGPDLAPLWRRAAEYVDKILKGAKPADLPIEQSSHYVLVVNLKTARALGLTIPESILLRADEVIR
jgi:putative ABC transport system substrate-binding protein